MPGLFLLKNVARIAALALLGGCTDREIGEATAESTGGSSSGGATDGEPPTTTFPPPPTTTMSTEPTTTEPMPTTEPPTTATTTLPMTTPVTITDTSTSEGDTSTGTSETSSGSEGSSSDDTSTGEPGVFTPLALELADFDGDDELDLLVLGVDEGLVLETHFSRGNGDGTFAPEVDAGLTGISAFPSVGPLDAAPGTDVIMDRAGPPLGIFRWVEPGPFAPWMEVEVPNILLNTRVRDGDDDGDGDIYALWATDAPKKFGVTFVPSSDGNFFFEPVTTQIGAVDVVGIDPNGLLPGDLNGDGFADALLFQSSQPNGLLRVFGTPQGAFAQPKVLTPGIAPWGGELADLDEDGDLDAVMAVLEPPSLAFLANDGAGGLTLGGATPMPAGFKKPFSIKVVDLDGDTHLDVAAIDDETAAVARFLGAGDGTLVAAALVDLPSPAIRIHAGLLDGDDAPDLVLATFPGGDGVTIVLSP